MSDDLPADENAPAELSPGSSRRSFLAVGGVAVGGTVLAGALSRAGGKPENLDKLAERFTPASVVQDDLGTTVVVRRSNDQCYVTLAYFNTNVDYTTSPPTLVKKINGIGVYLIVYFGDFDHQAPMHVAEEAYPLVAAHHFGKSAQKSPHSTGPIAKVPTSSSVDAPPVGAKYGGGSRLVFSIPDDRLPLPLDTEHLLDFVALPLTVAPNAVPPFTPNSPTSLIPSGIGKPTRPDGTVTAIELPYNLIVSPPARPSFVAEVNEFSPTTEFVNAQAPVTHDGWTELWHTRLAARVLTFNGNLGFLAINETDRDLRTIRAIWCNDAPFAGSHGDLAKNKSDNQISDDHDPNFLTSLTYDDRYDIVRLSSDFSSTSHGGPFRRNATRSSFGYVPQPATVDNLMLTSLGAWLDCDAHWDLKEPTDPKKHVTYFNSSLLSWRHRVVQGRDTYVRVVRKGYLFPWGHKASLITVTEREFSQEKTNGPVGAYLRQKTFIVITQPVKAYGGADPLMRTGGRHIPFTSVEAITLVTPDLETPAKYITETDKHGHAIQKNAETVFEPMLSNGAFLFHLRGTDWAGDLIDFRSPVLWVDDTAAYGTNDSGPLMAKVFDKWRGVHPTGSYPKVQLHNQRVSVATPNTAGDTQIVAGTLELSVETPKSGTSSDALIAASQPNFYPAMHSIEVEMPEAKVASGNPVGATVMQFEPSHYLPYGFDGTYKSGPKQGKPANKGKVFLVRESSSTRNKIKFSSANSGGSITPNLGVDGLSRAIGPISGDQSGSVDKYANGSVDPETIFHGVDARLMGGLPLSAIIADINFSEDDTSEALTLKTVQENEHRTVTHLDWHPTIQAGGPAPGIDVFVPAADGDPTNSMDLRALIIVDKADPAASRSIVVGQILDFELHLFGAGSTYFMLIPFDSLTFRAQTGQQTHVDVEIGADGVQFQGALSFVQDLADFLNFDGSGLTISTAGSAITADLTLAIPTIALGPFALENLAFSAGVAIPYDGDPVRFTFSFCSQENPFQLTIMVFTGGGFVTLGIGADGLEMLAFSLDFGLGISIDIGIASGQVSLTGGVYYEGVKDGDHQDVTLTAWVKASGGVSALGIISVSVELYLGLGYQSDGPGTAKLVGDADMTISVHILFFGGSVSVGMHEEFDVSGGGSNAVAGRNHARRHAIGAAEDDSPPPDNHFGQTTSADDWQTYCTSFALIGVGA